MAISDPFPTTTHRDFKIVFFEDRNLWNCNALGLESASLPALRKKIDRAISQASAVDSIPALEVSHDGALNPVTIISVIGNVPAKNRYDTDKVMVWVAYVQGNELRRKRVELHHLFPVRGNDQIHEYGRLLMKKREAERLLGEFRGQMRRFKLEDLNLPKDEESLP